MFDGLKGFVGSSASRYKWYWENKDNDEVVSLMSRELGRNIRLYVPVFLLLLALLSFLFVVLPNV